MRSVTLGESQAGKLLYFVSVERARFLAPVVLGEWLEIKVRKLHHRGPVWKLTGEAVTGGVLKAEATYSAMVVDD